MIRARRADEVTLDVMFDDLDPATGSQAGLLRCGDTVTRFHTGDAGAVHSDQVSVFAGLRRDPFFMDVRREVETRATRRLAFTDPGTDTVAGQNVLSIVIEVDAAHVLGVDRRPVWVVAAETASPGVPAPGSSGWVGRESRTFSFPSAEMTRSTRPSTSATSTTSKMRSPSIRQPPRPTRARLDANLAMFDALDDAIAWPFPPGSHHPLTEMWPDDHPVLDTTKPFSERGYLDLERAALTGRSPATCGGRWLNEDVIDALDSVIVRGWDGPPIKDGVDHATILARPKFPDLPAGNPNPPVADPRGVVPVGDD